MNVKGFTLFCEIAEHISDGVALHFKQGASESFRFYSPHSHRNDFVDPLTSHQATPSYQIPFFWTQYKLTDTLSKEAYMYIANAGMKGLHNEVEEFSCALAKLLAGSLNPAI